MYRLVWSNDISHDLRKCRLTVIAESETLEPLLEKCTVSGDLIVNETCAPVSPEIWAKSPYQQRIVTDMFAILAMESHVAILEAMLEDLGAERCTNCGLMTMTERVGSLYYCKDCYPKR